MADPTENTYPPRMSDLGGYPPRPNVPPDPGAGQDIPGWVIGVALAVVLAMAGALAFAILGSRGSDDDPAAAPPPSDSSPTGKATHASHQEPPHPAHWDKLIRPEVRLAQNARLLRFKHPVAVRFLPSPAFTKALLKDDQGSAYQTQQLEHAGDLLRSFGLLDDSVDVVAATDQFSGAAVLAYYSPETGSITVRGRRITPSVKATLVHELTHALQDQYFHFGAREQSLTMKHDPGADAEVSMLHTLAEGDAQRAEHDYEGTLTSAQLSALALAQQQEYQQAQGGLASVPPILSALGTPYDIAEGLVTAVTEYGGDFAVADLFGTHRSRTSSWWTRSGCGSAGRPPRRCRSRRCARARSRSPPASWGRWRGTSCCRRGSTRPRRCGQSMAGTVTPTSSIRLQGAPASVRTTRGGRPRRPRRCTTPWFGGCRRPPARRSRSGASAHGGWRSRPAIPGQP